MIKVMTGVRDVQILLQIMSDNYVILIESVIGKIILLFTYLELFLRKIDFAEVLLI